MIHQKPYAPFGRLYGSKRVIRGDVLLINFISAALYGR